MYFDSTLRKKKVNKFYIPICMWRYFYFYERVANYKTRSSCKNNENGITKPEYYDMLYTRSMYFDSTLRKKKKCINPRFLYACGDIFTFLNKSRIIKHVRRVKTMKMESASRNATICINFSLFIFNSNYAICLCEFSQFLSYCTYLVLMLIL